MTQDIKYSVFFIRNIVYNILFTLCLTHLNAFISEVIRVLMYYLYIIMYILYCIIFYLSVYLYFKRYKLYIK